MISSRLFLSFTSLTFTLVIACVSFADSGVPAVPYTETFNSTANWSTIGSGVTPVPPSFVTSGGPDGSSYIAREISAFGTPDLNPPATVVLARAQENFGSSGDQFENNWLTGGLQQVTFYARHNASVPLPFFVRFTNPGANFPGVIFQNGTSLSPSAEWTKLTFDITASNPFFTPEGSPALFTSVMSNVGRMQIGFVVPAGFGQDSGTYQYELDIVSSAVPEPSTFVLLFTAAALSITGRRNRGLR